MTVKTLPNAAAYSDSSGFWARVSARLGLKKPVTSELDFFQAIHKGISVKAVDVLQHEGLVVGEITLIID